MNDESKRSVFESDWYRDLPVFLRAFVVAAEKKKGSLKSKEPMEVEGNGDMLTNPDPIAE